MKSHPNSKFRAVWGEIDAVSKTGDEDAEQDLDAKQHILDDAAKHEAFEACSYGFRHSLPARASAAAAHLAA